MYVGGGSYGMGIDTRTDTGRHRSGMYSDHILTRERMKPVHSLTQHAGTALSKIHYAVYGTVGLLPPSTSFPLLPPRVDYSTGGPLSTLPWYIHMACRRGSGYITFMLTPQHPPISMTV